MGKGNRIFAALYDERVVDHPFVAWFAALRGMNAAYCDGGDVFLDYLGGKRFTLGVDPDGVPVLGILECDVSAVFTYSWSAAAFVKNYRHRDWVALSCRDSRDENSREMEPVPLRLWIPVSQGRLDAWEKNRPSRLRLKIAEIVRGQLVCLERDPLAELPLVLKGAWPKPPAAASEI